ncbi:MAG: GyrI-like domain-containing protein [Micropruina sp.]
MNEPVHYRPVNALTVYATSGVASGSGPENVGSVVDTIITRLDAALNAAGRPMIEPGVFWYEAAEGDDLTVHVSYLAEHEPVPGDGYDVVTLPAVETMATLLHCGDMSGIGESWSTLMQCVIEDGYRLAGPGREVYLRAEGHEPGPDWVTELQVPVEKA